RISVNGASVFAYRPDGKAFKFDSVGGTWVPNASVNHRLTELKNASGTRTGWQLYVPEGDETETYNVAGLLVSIRSRTGLIQTVIYSDGTGGQTGGFILDDNGLPTTIRLPVGAPIRVVDSFGRILAFGYNGALRVVTVTDPAGAIYRISYGLNHNLASITFPDGASRTFAYNEPANTGVENIFNALNVIVDENGSSIGTVPL